MSSPLASPHPWDLVAADYAEEIVPLFSWYAEDALGRVGVRSGDRVLDVAAGPGTLTFLAAGRGARVTAVDFSARMVEQLRARAERDRVAVDIHEADGQALSFAEGSFEAAFSMFGLMFFPDRAAGFAELHRVVVPGGRAAVSSWAPMDESPTMNALFAAIGAAMGEPTSPDRGFPLADVASCEREMTAAGFRDVGVHRVSHGADIPSLDLFWDSVCRTNAPLALMREGMGAKWAAMSAAIRAGIAERLGEGPVRLEMPAFLTIGTR